MSRLSDKQQDEERERVFNFIGEGFIRIPRKIVEWMYSEIPEQRDLYRVYTGLIVLCYYTPRFVKVKDNKVKCGVGEYLISQRKLSQRMDISRSGIQRILQLLEEEKLIKTRLVHQHTHIRVIGYEFFTQPPGKRTHPDNGKPASGKSIPQQESRPSRTTLEMIKKRRSSPLQA